MRAKFWQLLLLPLILSGCYKVANDAQVNTINGVVHFNGYITKGSILKTIELLEDENSKKELVFDSPGGANIPAINLANYIYDNKVKVSFQRQCYSACANYILPASQNMGLVKKGTIVGWHGGAYQDIWEVDLDKAPDVKERIELWKVEEDKLFNKLKLDKNITVYGILNNFNLLKSNSFCGKIFDEGDYQGWTYKMSDLKRMGVKTRFEDDEIPLTYNGELLQCYIYPFTEHDKD